MTQLQATSAHVTLQDIRAAAERIAGVARVTPILDVSGAAGRPLLLKCESLQPAGAFKIRGAYNMVAQLDPTTSAAAASSPTRRAITARRWRSPRAALGAPAVVVMPTTAPQIKVDGARASARKSIFEGTTSPTGARGPRTRPRRAA